MAQKFPTDRFDEIPTDSARVGVHRAAPRKYRRLKFVLWTLLAVVVLSGVGIGAVVVVDNGIFNAADDTIAAPTPTVAPTVDPNVPITVLNGTPTAGLDESAAAELTAAGFTVESSTSADKTDLTESVVYYSAAENEAVARGVAEALGIAKVTQSDAFDSIGSPVTVVLGTDFVPSPVG